MGAKAPNPPPEGRKPLPTPPPPPPPKRYGLEWDRSHCGDPVARSSEWMRQRGKLPPMTASTVDGSLEPDWTPEQQAEWKGETNGIVSPHPSDGALLFVTPRDLSNVERERLRREVERCWQGGYTIVCGDNIKTYQAVGGKWVELGAESTSTGSQRFTALLAVALAVVTTILFAVLAR